MLFRSHFHANQSHFHKNGFTLRLALKQRHKGTQKFIIVEANREFSQTTTSPNKRFNEQNNISARAFESWLISLPSSAKQTTRND